MFTNINVEITCLGFVLNCSFKTAGIDMTGFVLKPLYNFEWCQSDCHCYSLRISKKYIKGRCKKVFILFVRDSQTRRLAYLFS